MLSMYAKEPSNLEAIDRLFQQMKDKGVELTNVAFGIIMNAYASRNQIKKVETLYTELKKRNILPTEVIFSVLIKSYAKAQKPSKFMHLYEDIKSNYELSEVTLNMLLTACSFSSRIDLAEKIWKDMNENYPKAVHSITYNTMINLYAKNNQILKCIDLIDLMFEKEVPITRKVCDGIFSYLKERDALQQDAAKMERYLENRGDRPLSIPEWKKLCVFLGVVKKYFLINTAALSELIARQRADLSLPGKSNDTSKIEDVPIPLIK